ncbi:MAG: phage portal protein [Clostridiales bacterium]|nr:phage portal protein [Clostridiales bacterium]
MANELRAFMASNVESEEEIEFVVSPRFNIKGEPVKWRLSAITSKEDEALRKECTRKVPIAGRRGQRIPETDVNEYLGKMVVACVIHPNLNDKALQDSYNVMGASELLKTMLKPGEYSELTAKIQEINGYDVSMEEKIEEAKN